MMNEKMDVLDREGFIKKLESLVALLAESRQGCCFGIDGAWGSGKSFVIEKFEDRIKGIQSEETADNKYYVFHYDCWKYDYYAEPLIAIVAAMLDATDEELHTLSADIRERVKLGWETVKSTLGVVAGKICKEKIGIDLVEITNSAKDKREEESDNTFDSLFGFKRALDETRKGIQTIADSKTVVIIVDELDRCLPEYTIKILERLHHIFHGLQNVIVIVSMDKKQIEHSIHEIYGEIEVDTYLRKFIAFKVNLDVGKARDYIKKYETYTSMFEFTDQESIEIEKLFADLMIGMDMRTQERIFSKAEIIHRIVRDEKIKDSSIMTFEILFLTVSMKLKSTQLRWLIRPAHYANHEKALGTSYYNMLVGYENSVRSSASRNGCCYIMDNLIGKTFFWIANIYSEYNDGECPPYYYGKQAKERVVLVKKFAELINIIDDD